MAQKRNLSSNDSANEISPIDSLPIEMIEKILAHLAASSRIDLFQAKLSCRLFNEVGNGDYVHRNISLDGLHLNGWYMRKEEISFFEKCLACENPQACYEEGMLYFLRDPRDKHGIDYLKRAAKTGHAKASYVLGIELVCNGDESDRQHGLKLLGSIESSCLMRECRKDLSFKLKMLNVTTAWSIPLKFLDCLMIDPRKKTPAWPLFDHHEDQMRCQTCRWNLEIHFVDVMLRNVSYYIDPPERCERIID